MRAFILRRIGIGILTLLVVSIVVFLLSRMIGNPVNMFLDVSATPEDRARLAASMGLDKPLYTQYLVFMRRILLHGDLGRSLSQNRPVTEVFFSRFWNTIELGAVSFLISMAISLPIGVLAAVRRDSWWDLFAKGFVLFGQALPHFWLGIMLILIFSVKLNLVPPAGKGGPLTFILPAITLGWGSAAGVTRLVRSAMLEILSSDFIRTARSKGLPEFTVLTRHALKNALIPTVAYFSVVLVRAFVIGSIVVETVFGWPGIGRLAYDVTLGRDFPMIQGLVLMIAVIVILANLACEILYGWLDPRIRYE